MMTDEDEMINVGFHTYINYPVIIYCWDGGGERVRRVGDIVIIVNLRQFNEIHYNSFQINSHRPTLPTLKTFRE